MELVLCIQFAYVVFYFMLSILNLQCNGKHVVFASNGSIREKWLYPHCHIVDLSAESLLLGGNSRTAMVAALSPADINYDETLSTLR